MEGRAIDAADRTGRRPQRVIASIALLRRTEISWPAGAGDMPLTTWPQPRWCQPPESTSVRAEPMPARPAMIARRQR